MKFTKLSNTHTGLTLLVAGLLLMGLLITAMLARSKRTEATLVAQKDFAFVCREIQDKIDDRLTAYEQILRSAMAFIEHSEGVTRQEWQHFVTEQQLEHQLPGIQGLGFALLIPRSELAQHIQTIRAEGFPDYQVHPVGDREIYSSIIYLEPFTNLNLRAFGYDMFSEQVRRTAMERARDENRAALSGKVILVQETGQNIQAGTLMYLPVFHKKMPTATVDQRRAAIYGWVYSPFRMSDLMRGILRGRDLTGTRRSIRLEVFAGDLITPTALLYNSQPGENSLPIPAERLTLQRRLVIAGEHWTLRFTQTDSALADDQSWIIWLSGITTSLLLAGIFLSLLNTRYKALLAAHRLSTALQASTDKYRHLVENLPTGVLVFNIDATLLLANPLAVRLFGRSEDQLRKLTATASEWDFLREDATALSPAEYPFNQVLTTGQAITDRVIGIRQPNRTDNIWMLCSAYPQPTPSGQLSQVIVCFNNITARKLAEEQLYNSNRRLVTTLTTLRQTQAQLIQQEKLRGLGQIASGVAHDFNNALSPIIGFTELLLQDPVKLANHELVVKWLTNIHTCAVDATKVVHRLRESSRQHMVDGDLRTIIELNPLILQTLELTRLRWENQAQAAGCNIHIATDLGSVPAIFGEEFAIRELLINLIYNAVDALPDGGTITLGTALEGGVVRVWISDTGTGMTPEVQHRCFEPFFTTKGAENSGLGLSMVHGIVQRHGGTVAVASELGLGALFTIRLPIHTAAVASTIPTEVPALTRKLRVLVVDDESLQCLVISACLTNDGHTAVTVVNGMAALTQLQTGTFDLVITDKAMAGMNGEQLVATIHQRAPSLPVIMLTGLGDLMKAAGAIPPDISALLSKPITPMSLRTALAKVFPNN